MILNGTNLSGHLVPVDNSTSRKLNQALPGVLHYFFFWCHMYLHSIASQYSVVFSCSIIFSMQPIYCSCFLKFGKSGGHKGQFLGMVAFCKLATLSKIKEMVVGTFFKTKHSLDLSYTSVDTRSVGVATGSHRGWGLRYSCVWTQGQWAWQQVVTGGGASGTL